MNNDKTPVNTEETVTPAMVSRRAAIQRGLRKGGMVAAPVLMTTVGRSAMAGTVHGAKTPSGFCSINMSRPSSINCTGKTPAAWCGTTNWSGTGCTPGQKFNTVFTNCPSAIGNKTLKEVLQCANVNASSDLEIGGYCVAAYLNCKLGSSPVITKTHVINMWNGRYTGYQANATTYWTGRTICNYLSTQTMA